MARGGPGPVSGAAAAGGHHGGFGWHARRLLPKPQMPSTASGAAGRQQRRPASGGHRPWPRAAPRASSSHAVGWSRCRHRCLHLCKRSGWQECRSNQHACQQAPPAGSSHPESCRRSWLRRARRWSGAQSCCSSSLADVWQRGPAFTGIWQLSGACARARQELFLHLAPYCKGVGASEGGAG